MVADTCNRSFSGNRIPDTYSGYNSGTGICVPGGISEY